VLLMRRSILTERIARRGVHLTREYTVDPFDVLRVSDIMTNPANSLSGSIPLAEAIAFFGAAEGATRHKSYPVVDEEDRAIGMVSRSDVLRWTREGWNTGDTLASRSTGAPVVGYPEELVGQLADRMAAADLGRVPIVERQTGKLVGLVARRDLLAVRQQIIREENDRGRILKLFG
jgi:CBS domain-containing protein